MVRAGLSFVAVAGVALLTGCLQDFEQFRGTGGGGGGPTTTTNSSTSVSVSTGMTCDPATCPGPDTDCQNPVCNSGACAIGFEASGTVCDDGVAGSKVCDGAGTCVECNGNPDCAAPTPVCLMNLCVAEHCQNTTLDTADGETDIDCGGVDCPPCMNTQGCLAPTDCLSGFCDGTVCDACAVDDECDETVQWCNGGNNGGTCEAKKPDGTTCGGDNECTSTNCVDGVCCGSDICPSCQSCNIPGMEGTCNNDPNGTGCNDNTHCNGTDTCDAGACSVHSGDPCLPLNTTDGDCSGTCNESADDCSGNDPNGTGCNDGTYCNGTDTCSNGSCSTHSGDPCLPLNTTNSDCSESCNESNDTCTANDPNTTACNDGMFCNGNDTCNNSGSCANHAGDPCDGPDGDSDCSETCDENANNCNGNDPNLSTCDDGLFCNGNDTCNNAGACNNHIGDPCTGPLCTDACNEGMNNCTMQQPNGSACDADMDSTPGTCNGGGMCSD